MKRKWWTVCFLSILAGSALHFLYDLWPNPLTAVFAPVSESVWEHLKLLYWPFLAAAFVLTKDEADGRKSWCGLLAGLLGAPLLLLGAYYTLLSGLGFLMSVPVTSWSNRDSSAPMADRFMRTFTRSADEQTASR